MGFFLIRTLFKLYLFEGFLKRNRSPMVLGGKTAPASIT
jgi:hypothetical protein